MKKIASLVALLLVCNSIALADDLVQNIRGRVVDKIVQTPLPGANVILSDTDPVVGVITDAEGYFVLKNVPVGRVDIEISFIGYYTVVLKNLMLSAAKELVLQVEMEERVLVGEEIVVTAPKEKANALNEMAILSARTFSVEESQRFAGARNDVSRMASYFAGVQAANDQVNDIVIRGNAPGGLLWRLEGVDVPNPNHYGQLGATGGPVSMLNNNTLSNSDFITAAFPAEYGNATSGVFDLNMRNGNYERREFMGQVGFNGFELGAEGPLFKGNNSSYIINYRYSVLSFMDKIGLNPGTGTGIPNYQDLSFKINNPIKNVGNFTVFGLGGISEITFKNSEVDPKDKEEDFYTNGDFDIYNKVKTGVLGVSQNFLINTSTYAKATVAYTSMQTLTQTDSLIFTAEGNAVDDIFHNYYGMNFMDHRWFASAYLNKKFSQKNNIRLGLMVNEIHFNLSDTVYSIEDQRYYTITDDEGNTSLLQGYVSWQHRFSNNLTFNSGLHTQYLTLNDNYAVEPRLGLKWNIGEKDAIGIAYGLHSQMLPVQTYFRKAKDENYDYFSPNVDLSFIKSHHYVLGYDRIFNADFRIKAEAYYQRLSGIPVDVSPSSFSMTNVGSFSGEPTDSLKSSGFQRNYGVEFTLEKFLSSGYYFLFTTSVFDSKYKGSDGVLRNSAFDGNYVVNLVGGSEWVLNAGKRKDKVNKLLVDGRITAAGGKRYTPVDLQKSMESNETVFQDDMAFTEKFADYFRADLRLAFRMDNKKYANEFAIDIQNITNHKNPFGKYYNRDKGEVITQYQLGIYPMMQYKIEF